jgi:peptidoglycan/LPS O-acetylase OafA/YrhL
MIRQKSIQSDINGVRGWSVLLVMLFHFNIQIFKGGFVGVDVFFVISGYLMTKIVVSGSMNGSFDYVEFIFRRMQRIFPALFAMMSILACLGIVFLPPGDLNALSDQILQATLFNSNNYYAAQDSYFSADVDNRWLLHTWSLAVEWQFYMLYPILVWGICKVAKTMHRGQGFVFLCLSVVCLASLIYCIWVPPHVAFFSVFARAWQMIAGGLVFLTIQRRLIPDGFSASMSYGGFVLAGVSIFVVKHLGLEYFWPSYHAILPVCSVCLLLLANYEKNILLNNVVMRNLGAWSYSIYLWHWPVVIALTISGLLYDFPRISKIAGIACSVLLGCLSFYWVESIRFSQNFSKRTFGAVIAASAVALASISLYVSSTSGFLGRTNQPLVFKNLEDVSISHTYRASCENNDGTNKHFCHINQGASGQKILVVGDSHAGHLYPWFLKNSSVSTTFFVKSGCPFIDGFERAGMELGCRAFFNKAVDLIKSGAYDTVIVSQNWSWYSKASASICTYENGQCVPLRYSRNPMSAQEKTRSTLLGFLSKNINVVVLNATPHFEFNVPNRIARNMFWYGKEQNSYDSAGFFAENSDWDTLFAELEENPHFHVLSLRSEICKDSSCKIFDEANGIAIFKDKSHLNPAWVEKHGNVFLPYVRCECAVSHTASACRRSWQRRIRRSV